MKDTFNEKRFKKIYLDKKILFSLLPFWKKNKLTEQIWRELLEINPYKISYNLYLNVIFLPRKIKYLII
jgi:hypothetical protein